MKYCAIATLLVSLSVSAAANASKAPGSGPNPFSDCGIGAALFPEHKVLAVSSNIIWDIGTTAVTSATASPETCSGKNVDAAAFILNSYDSLVEDTARGEGEHLTALLSILDVEQTAQADVVAAVRAEMAEQIAADAYIVANKTEKSQMFYFAVINAVNAA
ncbi:DUF3015 family protein [Arsukibacterium sp.]|jgi:hypothetical protein|uniref:DUF3015 family protein n=1 Tax=Arsukibacterium sp. TaxID=1977258 RepID=UPI002FDB5683